MSDKEKNKKEKQIELRLYPLWRQFTHLYLIHEPASLPGYSQKPELVNEHFLIYRCQRYWGIALIFIMGVDKKAAEKIFGKYMMFNSKMNPNSSLFSRCIVRPIDLFANFFIGGD